MRMSGEGEVAVDLVGDDPDVVPAADLPDAAQLLRRPHAAHRVVRAAQQKELHLRIHDFALEVVEVDPVVPVAQAQRALRHAAVVVPDHAEEGIVHRRLDQHGVTGPGQRAHGHGQRKHHAGRLDQPLRLRPPAEVPLEPVGHGRKVCALDLAVTEDAVRHDPLQRIQHGLGRGEIHIRHPQRQHVRRASALHGEIVLQAVGVPAIDLPIEVILRHAHASMACFRSAMMSSTCSRPTDRRSSVSVMPRCMRISSGTSW